MSSLRDPPLYWTLRQGGESLPLGRSVKRKVLVVFHLLFHLDAVFTSCLPFIVEFSNIINIEI